jgi:hypothetical protein
MAAANETTNVAWQVEILDEILKSIRNLSTHCSQRIVYSHHDGKDWSYEQRGVLLVDGFTSDGANVSGRQLYLLPNGSLMETNRIGSLNEWSTGQLHLDVGDSVKRYQFSEVIDGCARAARLAAVNMAPHHEEAIQVLATVEAINPTAS